MLMDAALRPAPDRLAAVEAAWDNLTGPGPTLTAAERIEIIETARRAWAGDSRQGQIDDVTRDVAHWVARDAGGLTADAVDQFESRGLDRFRYLETVGIVARTANVDFYARALGASLPTLPEPSTEPPTGKVHPEASITNGWVPATGPLIAPFTLDALPAEGEALRSLHHPMYLPMQEIANGAYRDELTRPQIEYVAARTSYLNECFY